jgi:hypothetical protein
MLSMEPSCPCVLVLIPGNMDLYVAIAAIGFISARHAFLEEQAAFLNLLSTPPQQHKQLRFRESKIAEPPRQNTLGARA